MGEILLDIKTYGHLKDWTWADTASKGNLTISGLFISNLK